MRILFVHNKYGVVSGEEIMINRIISMLKEHGHEVETFYGDSKGITSTTDKIAAFFSGVWSFSARRELKHVIEEFKPDIVQIQNLFPLISPSILPLLRKLDIPVVMRLSNYRLACPTGLFFSKGELCERCRGGREYWCVVRNCEDNVFKSLGYALRNWVARYFRLYINNVTRYYAQTMFQKTILVSEGFDESRIDIIPNMVEICETAKDQVLGSYVGFVGRMSPEKGIDTFLEAAERCPDISFKIAGDSGRFKQLSTMPNNVELLGHLDDEALSGFYRNSRFIVVPSLWYEGFPGVIIEAMCHGKPVLASRIGGLPDIVDNKVTGYLFNPDDPSELVHLIARLWDSREEVVKLGMAGKDKVTNEYSPDTYYRRLMRVYSVATHDKSGSRQI